MELHILAAFFRFSARSESFQFRTGWACSSTERMLPQACYTGGSSLYSRTGKAGSLHKDFAVSPRVRPEQGLAKPDPFRSPSVHFSKIEKNPLKICNWTWL